VDPAILFDGDAEHVAVAGSGSVSLYSLALVPNQARTSLIASLLPLGLVTDPAVSDMVRKEREAANAGPTVRAAVVQTRAAPGGADISVSGQRWRLFSESARRVTGVRDEWTDLKAAGLECTALENLLKGSLQGGFESSMFESGSHCVEIQHGDPKGMNTDDKKPSEQVLVAVYNRPLDVGWIGATPPSSIASLSRFGRFDVAGTPPVSQKEAWMLGQGPERDGWIARKIQGEGGVTLQYAAPWSTSALKRLAQGVLPAASAGSSGR
jgi:hypothetical protein